MVRWLWNLLYGSVPAEFESAFGLEESVRRLAEATGRSVFSALTRQRAVGTVSQFRVSLQRAIPFVGNSFKPFFVGRFEERDGHIVLTGKFSMLWWAKGFMSIWFGFISLWTLFALVVLAMKGASEDWWFPLFGVGMLVAGVALLWSAQWFSRRDPEWLSNVIRQALSPEPRR